MLVEHMEKGLSFESFAGVLRVSKQTLYNWAEQNQEFLDAKNVGTELARLWWESKATDYLLNMEKTTRDSDGNVETVKTSLNSTVWIFNMKNRFKDEWKDKHENEFSGSIGTVIMPTPLDEDLQEND